MWCHGVLVGVSTGYPPETGKLLTRYAPLRRSPSSVIANTHAAPRLACVKPAASVHPEPGSNSSLYNFYIILSLSLTLIILSKELTLLDKLYFLGTCFLYSNQSFQWTSHILLREPVFRTGLQRYALFSNFQTYLKLFFQNFFSVIISAPVF